MAMKRFIYVDRVGLMCLVWMLAVAVAAVPVFGQGITTTIAVTGQQAGDVTRGVVFRAVRNPVLNDLSQTAYHGFLEIGTAGVDETNDVGIWRDKDPRGA